LAAFACYLDSSAEDRYEVIKNYESQSKENPVTWEIYLSAVAGNSRDDAVEIIRQVEKSPAFRIEQANDQRALYGRFAQNKKLSLQSQEGRKFLSEVLARLSEINEYSTVNILSVFGNIDKMEKEYHIPLVDMLISLKEKLDQKRTPGVYNTIRRLLIGAPVAIAEYEEYSGQH
ncbi:MAG: aminopeptidase N C-terminal domain-containing protein, partial [Methanogenium sp.]|nr:aminopeptidase N C-terminal domain-containing protein [Methanogenium sp.]